MGRSVFSLGESPFPWSELRNWGRVSITTFSIQVLKTSTTALIRGIFDVSLSKQTNFYVVCHAKAKKGKGKRKPLLRIQIHSKARRLWTWWLVIEATLQSNSGQNVGLHRAPFFWLWWIHPCNLQASGGVKKSIVSSTSFEADQNYNHGNCAWWRQKF